MKKSVLLAVFAATMLTGCYSTICPTYSVKPVDAEEMKADHQPELTPQDSEAEKAS